MGALSNKQFIGNALFGLGGALSALGAPPEQRGQVANQQIAMLQELMAGQRAQKEKQLAFDMQMEDRKRQLERERVADDLKARQAQAAEAAIGQLPQNLQDFARADNSVIGQYISGQMSPGEAPKTVGGMQWDQSSNQFVPIPGYTEQAEAVARAGRAPERPEKPDRPRIVTLYDQNGTPKSFFDNDPQIQDAINSGWVDARPPSDGVVITNPDGTVTRIGGRDKPVSAADQQTRLRSSMIGDALAEFEGINFDNVRSPMIAAADATVDSKLMGPIVNSALNEDEKKLLGNQGKIQEAVISAITGAAYSEEQKQNMRAAYVPLSTDDLPTRTRKLKDAAKFLAQLSAGGGQPTPSSAATVFVRDASGKIVPKAQ